MHPTDLCSAATILAGTPARATETVAVTLDGVWWQGLDLHEQLVAVQGMIEALDSRCAMGSGVFIIKTG
jgi:hypothetical protein